MTVNGATLIILLLVVPFLGGTLCLVMPTPRRVLTVVVGTSWVMAALSFLAAWKVFTTGNLSAGGEWFFLDALSAYHLAVLAVVFVLSSLYAGRYFSHESASGHFGRSATRRFGGLWLGAAGAMTVVLVSNNLGMIWVGIEATTLLTAFLICLHVQAASLEAMWKYLIMCSVGVAFAFLGTLFVVASAGKSLVEGSDVLLWTHLASVATQLDPTLLKVGFIFLLVGFGTKAGLAPMHNWLPDAHSQAPAPVSALFSGFLLNCALYCIMRYVPLVELGTGSVGWSRELLMVLGLLSILIAAGFIVFQRDAKRLLAYSSVEHVGIITLGIGLGGFGTFAAMFHIMNHSVCKSLGFFSAGRLGQIYRTHDLGRMKGVLRASPVWGSGFFLSLLALIGTAPFAIFMSEFQILRAALDRGAILTLVLFLAGTGIVFVGALRHAITAAWDTPETEPAPERAGVLDYVLVFAPIVFLVVVGCYLPGFLQDVFGRAAEVIGGPR